LAINQVIELSGKIKSEAIRLGFLACGISKAGPLENSRQPLNDWLNNGYNGEMHYMQNHFDKRLDPCLLFENAKSVISVLLNYFPVKEIEKPGFPILSKYAYGMDYHFVMKEKLLQLLGFIQTQINGAEGKLCVDSAPVLEREWARRAGLGWIGKNTNLLNKNHGSFFFIGEIITNIELPDDKPLSGHCGHCTKCIDACPTGALVKPYQLDARRCISYLTIEHKGELPPELKDKFHNRAFGCDICQDVCPWNKKAKPHDIKQFEPSFQLNNMTVDSWQNLTKTGFNEVFKNSAIKRTKYEGLKRNINYLFDI
jgi:epoxyqueuosine reductase